MVVPGFNTEIVWEKYFWWFKIGFKYIFQWLFIDLYPFIKIKVRGEGGSQQSMVKGNTFALFNFWTLPYVEKLKFCY